MALSEQFSPTTEFEQICGQISGKFGDGFGGGFGMPEHRFDRFFFLGIDNLEKNRSPFGAETRPTKFDKK